MKITIALISNAFLILTLSACAILMPQFDEYEYCGGTNYCCGFTDTRNNHKSYFCVDDPSECVSNDYQSSHFPANPGENRCQAEKRSDLLQVPAATRFALDSRSQRLFSEIERFISSHHVRMITNLGDLDCSFVCASESPICNGLSLGFDYEGKLVELAELVRRSESVVHKSDIMEVFNQTEDGCNRSNLTIQGDRFSNEGQTQTCMASINLNVGTGGVARYCHNEGGYSNKTNRHNYQEQCDN